MHRLPAFVSICFGAALAVYSQTSQAQFAPVGNLDCNGYSKIQAPLRPQMTCSDLRGPPSQRPYDNGWYIGHDEPSTGFISTLPHSGNSVQWDITLPSDQPLPAPQTFENMIAFWFAMAVCDDNSYPGGRVSRIATRTRRPRQDRRSSSFSSTRRGSPRSSRRSAAI
jgi:hypothetical protein